MTKAAAMATKTKSNVLGIIAGDGRLPAMLIDACKRAKRPYFVMSFDDVDAESRGYKPNAIHRLGALGDAMNALREAGVSELVLAGKIARPSLATLRPDVTATRLLTRLGAAFFLGDDALFKAIVSFLESEGFRVIGSDDVLVDIVTPEGVLGKHKPGKAALADIDEGIRMAKNLGKDDIGQAVIVREGKVLGVEDSQGTDALIARCTDTSFKGRSGVLVKAKKPGQETRVDLPAIGPRTVENCHKAGLSGIAVEAGGSIIIDRKEVIALADKLGLFVIGVHE